MPATLSGSSAVPLPLRLASVTTTVGAALRLLPRGRPACPWISAGKCSKSSFRVPVYCCLAQFHRPALDGGVPVFRISLNRRRHTPGACRVDAAAKSGLCCPSLNTVLGRLEVQCTVPQHCKTTCCGTIPIYLYADLRESATTSPGVPSR